MKFRAFQGNSKKSIHVKQIFLHNVKSVKNVN